MKLTLGILFIIFFGVLILSCDSDTDNREQISIRQNSYFLFPHIYPEKPEIASPVLTEKNREIVTIKKRNSGFALMDVTAENGRPYSYRFNLNGKGNQLLVSENIPGLSENGLYQEEDLWKMEYFGGRSLEILNLTGRPKGFSHSGFIAEDEDFKSVLIGDNRLVSRMQLTHPQMAVPLFHVWNLLREIREGIEYLDYNRQKIHVGGAPTKDYQESIFHDEIEGTWDISIWRELEENEIRFIEDHYASLSPEKLEELKYKISHLRIGEIHPFYIMRYGFYEGHTMWRADPVAISFIFGFKTVAELEKIFPGRLHEVLTTHFTPEYISR